MRTCEPSTPIYLSQHPHHHHDLNYNYISHRLASTQIHIYVLSRWSLHLCHLSSLLIYSLQLSMASPRLMSLLSDSTQISLDLFSLRFPSSRLPRNSLVNYIPRFPGSNLHRASRLNPGFLISSNEITPGSQTPWTPQLPGSPDSWNPSSLAPQLFFFLRFLALLDCPTILPCVLAICFQVLNHLSPCIATMWHSMMLLCGPSFPEF